MAASDVRTGLALPTARGGTVPKPLLQVVIASTRPGRVGLPVAQWFTGRARAHGAFEVEVVDLAEVGLPLLDEPHHPRLGRYTHDHTKAWSATVARGDAYVFVMPEYNYGFNAALKNALDYVFVEWHDKAVSFVSYGGVSGGLRAVQMLKLVLSALKLMPTQNAVAIPFVATHIGDGRFQASELMEAGATATLDELAKLTQALLTLREVEPTTV